MASLAEVRRHLHAHPELSEAETATQAYLLKELQACLPTKIERVAKTGLLAIFGPLKKPGILIRGDIDALPIAEENDFPHRSQKEGISHKCGHDGHTVILLGLARELGALNALKTSVLLLFQPAEEIGAGARQVKEDPVFKKHPYQWAFALHNIPGFIRGKILLKEGYFTPSVCSLAVKVQGWESHAAEPEQGRSPAGFLHHALGLSKDFRYQNLIITPVHLRLGEPDYGISPGEGEIHFTVRTQKAADLDAGLEALEAELQEQAELAGLQIDLERLQEFRANHNHPEAIAYLRQAAQVNDFSLQELKEPFPWGEDFGLLHEDCKGAMFGLGAGKECLPLHHPAYDFPDEIIETGVQTFLSLIQAINDGEYQ